MTVHLLPHELPTAKSPVFYGERLVGMVEPGTDDDILIIKLIDLSPLVRELIKAEMVSFEIVNNPSVRA